jgi:hypothetical protein
MEFKLKFLSFYSDSQVHLFNQSVHAFRCWQFVRKSNVWNDACTATLHNTPHVRQWTLTTPPQPIESGTQLTDLVYERMAYPPVLTLGH